MADDIVSDDNVDVNSDAADAQIAADMAAEDKGKGASDDTSSVDKDKDPAADQDADTKPADKPKEGSADADKDANADADKADADADKDADADADKDADADADADTKPAKGADARKAQLQSEIRDLVARKNQLRDETASKTGEHYAAKTAEELIEDGVDPAEARVQALEQKQELKEWNDKVSDLNQSINVESLQIMADFPMFNPGTEADPNPEFNSELSEMAKETYNKAANIQVDKNTELIVSANVLPYDIYKSFADAYSLGAASGTIKGEQAADKNEAAADTPSSAAPKPKKTDPFLAGLQS